MSDSGVYVIKNIVNGKCYIGSTDDGFNCRFNTHKSRLSRNTHSNKHLQNAWNKYGEGNFKFEALIRCKNNFEREQDFLDFLFDNYNYDQFYNRKRLALGHKMSNETKNKLSEKRKGKDNPFYGKSHTEETKNILSEKLSGRERHDHEIKNTSESLKGRSYSQERKDKVSEANKGKVLSEEHKNKIKESVPKGSDQPNSKLDEDDVKEIKKLLKESDLYQYEIAEKFDVSSHTVRHIKKGRNWTHVTLEGN